LLHDIVRLSIRPALADLAASEVTVTPSPTLEPITPRGRERVPQRIDIVNCTHGGAPTYLHTVCLPRFHKCCQCFP
jgi:hypothetical protein